MHEIFKMKINERKTERKKERKKERTRIRWIEKEIGRNEKERERKKEKGRERSTPHLNLPLFPTCSIAFVLIPFSWVHIPSTTSLNQRSQDEEKIEKVSIPHYKRIHCHQTTF